MQFQAKDIKKRLAHLEEMTLEQLDELHYDCEVAYRGLIMTSKKGSGERKEIFSQAYESVTQILMERRKRLGVSAQAPLGFSPSIVAVICARLGPPPARILDIGCGTGSFIEKMVRKGYQADGIDLSEECIRIGADRIRGLTGGSLQCGDFLEADLPSSVYDLIHTNDVLEHLHPDQVGDFLTKCHRILKPDGILWLVTVNRWTGPGDATSLRHPLGSEARGLHLKEHTLWELDRELARAGFKNKTSRLFNSGRFRPGTGYRSLFHRIKIGIEPALARLPFRFRAKLMAIMSYSETVAQKR